MKLIRGIHNLVNQSELENGCVLAIGNFDGVHLGHQKILQRLSEKALLLKLPSVVMIFEPQPREFFAKNSQNEVPARLMHLRDKVCEFGKLGIDFVLCIRFNDKFSALLPDQFIQQLLVNRLHIRYLSVGDDFRFGLKRQGNFEMLKQAGEKFGFEVENSPSHCLGKDRISSSLIRQALACNNIRLAEKLLGKAYSIRGKVTHGNKLGRTIGFPTANIMLNRLVTPIQGVYAVRVILNEQVLNGIANVGNRPTINGTKPLLEVHLFNFSQMIYGQMIEVCFVEKIRTEIKFASIDALKQQIAQDVEQAKFFLNMED